MTLKNHQFVHELAARPVGVDRVELAAAMEATTGEGSKERARSALSSAATWGVVYAAKAPKVLTRYFTHAAHAVAFLQRKGADIPANLIRAANAEWLGDMEHAVRMGADPEILVAQRRTISRMEDGLPDRPIAPRAGQDDWRQCPSLISGQRIARQGQQGGAA